MNGAPPPITALVGAPFRDAGTAERLAHYREVMPRDTEWWALVSIQGEIGVDRANDFVKRAGNGMRQVVQHAWPWAGGCLNFEPNKAGARKEREAGGDVANEWTQSFRDGEARDDLAQLLAVSLLRMRVAAGGLRVGAWGVPETRDHDGVLRVNQRYTREADRADTLFPSIYTRGGWTAEQCADRARRSVMLAGHLYYRDVRHCMSPTFQDNTPISAEAVEAQVRVLRDGAANIAVWIDCGLAVQTVEPGLWRILEAVA